MAATKQNDLIWVESLRLELKLKGKAITRAACDRLINKWTKERIKLGNNKKGRAFIEKDVAEHVKDYFSRKHTPV